MPYTACPGESCCSEPSRLVKARAQLPAGHRCCPLLHAPVHPNSSAMYDEFPQAPGPHSSCRRPPWPRLKAAADSSCRRRNRLSTRAGLDRWKIHRLASISRNPRAMPNSGDSGMNRMVFSRLLASSTPKPALATPAPANPPMSACEDEVGRPQPPGEEVLGDRPSEPGED